MCTKKKKMFDSYFSTAYRSATENSSLLRSFTEESISGNDHKLIEIISEITELKNLSIKESYIAKNDEEAKNFLNKADRTDSDKEKLFYLMNAVFAAKFNDDNKKIFYQSLMRRISFYFFNENFYKCLKDSRYMITILNEGVPSDVKETEHRMYKIECLSYESRSLKALGDFEKAKILAREGIREAKNWFQIMEDEGAGISSENKLERLANFLGVLNGNKSDAESNKCKVLEAAALAKNPEQTCPPEVFGKRNSKLKSCSDALALRHDQKRGRHLVATRNIKIGSVLIVDEPFAWSTEAEMLQRNCLHCHESLVSSEAIEIPCRNCQTVKFCSEDCRRKSWESYHQWECPIFDYFDQNFQNQAQTSRLLLAYRTTVRLATGKMVFDDKEGGIKLSPELAKYYSKIEDSEDNGILEVGLGEDYDPLDYRTIYSLETNSKDIDPLLNLTHAIHAVILSKSFRFVSRKLKVTNEKEIKIGDADEHAFALATLRHLQAINCNAYEIVENVLDNESKIWEPRTVGGAIYATVSLTNHSCYPNIIRHTYSRGNVVVRAIRFIEKGEEIFDCYGPHYLRDIKSERQKYLYKKYNFYCACEACTNNLEKSTLSVVPFHLQPKLKCHICHHQILVNSSKNNTCKNCGAKIDRIKSNKIVEESIKRRTFAIQKILDGDHATALPVLLRHAELVDKQFPDYSFEAVKTQQALIQCFNSMGCISE